MCKYLTVIKKWADEVGHIQGGKTIEKKWTTYLIWGKNVVELTLFSQNYMRISLRIFTLILGSFFKLPLWNGENNNYLLEMLWTVDELSTQLTHMIVAFINPFFIISHLQETLSLLSQGFWGWVLKFCELLFFALNKDPAPFLWGVEWYSAVLRAYFYLCAQESLLADLENQMRWFWFNLG